MTLLELLKLIENIHKNKGTSLPYICGGTPRDKVLGTVTGLDDLDLTTGDYTIHKLARSVYEAIPGSLIKICDDGHAQIMIGSFKVDFSSNFKAKGVEEYLRNKNISNPTNMQLELYSRDFTCNALLLDLNLKTILDPTGSGVKDIQDKKIKTCLPAHFTLGVDHKRIIRIVYLAAKLGFDVDGEIIDFVRKNPQFVADCKPNYLSKKLKKSLDYNKDATVYWLDQLKLWRHLPPLADLMPYRNHPERI